MSGEIPYCTERRKPTGMSFLGLKTIAEKYANDSWDCVLSTCELSPRKERNVLFFIVLKNVSEKILIRRRRLYWFSLGHFDGRHNLLKESEPSLPTPFCPGRMSLQKHWNCFYWDENRITATWHYFLKVSLDTFTPWNFIALRPLEKLRLYSIFALHHTHFKSNGDVPKRRKWNGNTLGTSPGTLLGTRLLTLRGFAFGVLSVRRFSFSWPTW